MFGPFPQIGEKYSKMVSQTYLHSNLRIIAIRMCWELPRTSLIPESVAFLLCLSPPLDSLAISPALLPVARILLFITASFHCVVLWAKNEWLTLTLASLTERMLQRLIMSASCSMYERMHHETQGGHHRQTQLPLFIRHLVMAFLSCTRCKEV